MKVGIDVFCSDHGRSGIGSYIHSFVKNLDTLKENPKYTEIEFELFGSELDRFTYDSGNLRLNYNGVNISDTVSAERAWHIFKLNNFAKKINTITFYILQDLECSQYHLKLKELQL